MDSGNANMSSKGTGPDVESADWHCRLGQNGRMSQAALDAVVRLLDLEAIEVNIFRGVSPDEQRQRVFGGPPGPPQT